MKIQSEMQSQLQCSGNTMAWNVVTASSKPLRNWIFSISILIAIKYIRIMFKPKKRNTQHNDRPTDPTDRNIECSFVFDSAQYYFFLFNLHTTFLPLNRRRAKGANITNTKLNFSLDNWVCLLIGNGEYTILNRVHTLALGSVAHKTLFNFFVFAFDITCIRLFNQIKMNVCVYAVCTTKQTPLLVVIFLLRCFSSNQISEKQN